MNAMSPCAPDCPLMKAWEAYQETDDFKNSLMWAVATTYGEAGRDLPEGANHISDIQRKQHAEGSLWAAFMRGFLVATEAAASLHEQVNPASDEERDTKTPGAGGMGAVIQYRDLIRKQAVTQILRS